MTALGLAEIAQLELRYVTLPSFTEQTITVPVNVNVVPGDQAAGRIPDAKVRTELVYQQVQDEKRRAADALREGDVPKARDAYEAARERLAEQIEACPAPELDEESRVVENLRLRAEEGDVAHTAKASRMDVNYKSRKRGRRGPQV
jgi:Ca-activated chloride channel family protein